jgi:tryptophan 2,3-dioxygenase
MPGTRPKPKRIGEEERRRQARMTGGEPILDFDGEATPFVQYQESDVLLSLQNPQSGQHDEMAFLMSGQLMELMFKLADHELREAQRRIRADDVTGALQPLRRAARVQEVLVKMWDLVGTITPNQFLAFRDHLGTSSGFQSYAYRHLEFTLGNKVKAMLKPHRGSPRAHAALQAALEAPSLYDDVLALLARRGHAIPAEHLERDLAAPYEPHAAVEAAWLAVYREPESDLYALAEALVDVADLYKQWRYRHLVTVERVMGSKPGTGGTSGVTWLRRIAQHEFFPELWHVRGAL